MTDIQIMVKSEKNLVQEEKEALSKEQKLFEDKVAAEKQ
jgi:hypothetical protein